MFRIYFMPCSNDTALKQAERRFHGVRVHVAMRVSLRVIDGLVLPRVHVIERPRINRGFVRHHNFDVAPDIRFDNRLDCFRLCIFGANQAKIAVTLTNANDNLLDALCTPSALLAANVGFVNLDRAIQFLRRDFLHRSADAVAQIPRRLVAHSDGALDLARAHAFLGLTEQRSCNEPFPERQVRIVEDRPRRYAKLVVARIAVVLSAIGDGCSLGIAARALRAVFPAQLLKRFAALFIRAELLCQLN